ncbi:unnamed protein product [Owenia fusiformis]|uniref:RRM domain-containing protein n=1 Tax=Owenia fusiformis TaxID=6347 RepID=A0A8S4MVE1_OWEFU|nr:unnamed protein product [Owenia fusiformis]
MSKAEERANRRKAWWDKHRKKADGMFKEEPDDTVAAVSPVEQNGNNLCIKIQSKDQEDQDVKSEDKIDAQNDNKSESQAVAEEDSERPAKKRRRNKKSKNKDKVSNLLETKQESENNEKELDKSEKDSKETAKKPEKKAQKKSYVLFVGNLPYNVTKQQLEEHFIRTGGVKTIRLPTEKTTGKPRGFAYIEFKNNKAFMFALMLHHTELLGRQINVEFTSIGGNNKNRKDRLKLKNEAMAKYKLRPDEIYKPPTKKNFSKKFKQ